MFAAMKTNLADLIRDALEAKADLAIYEGTGLDTRPEEETVQLTLNALEESLTILIDSRIAKILNTQP